MWRLIFSFLTFLNIWQFVYPFLIKFEIKINALKLRSNSDLIPEEIKRIPNSTQIIGLIEMASMSCLNKFVFKGTNKKEIYEEYSSYLDYIKEIAIKKYKKNE